MKDSRRSIVRYASQFVALPPTRCFSPVLPISKFVKSLVLLLASVCFRLIKGQIDDKYPGFVQNICVSGLMCGDTTAPY